MRGMRRGGKVVLHVSLVCVRVCVSSVDEEEVGSCGPSANISGRGPLHEELPVFSVLVTAISIVHAR